MPFASSTTPFASSTNVIPWKTSTAVSTPERGAPAESGDWQSLLSDKSFDIEFHGYLSNHAKHAIIALHRLDAPRERVTEYWNTYTKLTPYSLELYPISWDKKDVSACTAEEFVAWRGKKVHWQQQVLFLQQELETTHGGNIDQLLQRYAPDLLPGMASALTHGIIHLGWGVDAQNTWMTLEGLAYLNFAYVAMPEGSLTTKTRDDDDDDEETPMDSIMGVALDFGRQNLAETWIQAAKDRYQEDSGFHPELIPSGFQWQLAKVLAHPHALATTLPSWLDSMDLPDLLEQVYRLATLLYLTTLDAQDGHGSFLVLHLLTSLWGAEQLCAVIGKETVTRTALKHYYAITICLLATSAGGFPSAEALQSTVVAYPQEEMDDGPEEDPLWKGIVDKAYLEEEEHNIKLVYVMRELWRRYGRWSGFRKAGYAFTLTPSIGSQAAYKA